MHSSKIASQIAALNAFYGKRVKIKQAITERPSGVPGSSVEVETTFSMRLDFVEFNAHRGMLRIGDANNESQLEFDAEKILHIGKIGNTMVFTELLGNVLERKTIIY